MDSKALLDSPPDGVASEMYRQVAPLMGWSMPRGIVKFRRSSGRGKHAVFLDSRLTDDNYTKLDREGRVQETLRAGQGGLIQITHVPKAPQVPSKFLCRVDGRTVQVAYGSAGELVKNPETGKMERTFQAKYIIPKISREERSIKDSCIEVNPQADFEQYAYLMLCPWNSMSPLHLPFEEKARLGITIEWSDPQSPSTPTMTPDFVDARLDRLDEIAAEDFTLYSKIEGMGPIALADVCLKAGIAPRGNSENPEKHYKARLKEVIENKNKPAYKAKYDSVKLSVFGAGDLKDYESIIRKAIKYNILSHDGVVWKTEFDGKKHPWTIMTDETSGSVATPGDEPSWLARKIVTDDMQTWFHQIDSKVTERDNELYDEVMRRGDGTNHDILSKCIANGTITRYDKETKEKVHKWAIDGTVICDLNGWGDDNMLKTLKEHFKDMPSDELAQLVISKTAPK